MFERYITYNDSREASRFSIVQGESLYYIVLPERNFLSHMSEIFGECLSPECHHILFIPKQDII